MKGTSSFTPVFSSRLAPSFARYVDLKRALGRRFDLSALPSAAQAIHILRGRSGETAQCGCALGAESGITASPGTDSACDSPPVHHGNAARRTAETDAR